MDIYYIYPVVGDGIVIRNIAMRGHHKSSGHAENCKDRVERLTHAREPLCNDVEQATICNVHSG